MERDVCDVNDSMLCGLFIGKVGDEEDKNVKTVYVPMVLHVM